MYEMDINKAYLEATGESPHYKIATTCCFCGKSLSLVESHNARPVREGRCCDECNTLYVLPERIKELSKALNHPERGGK